MALIDIWHARQAELRGDYNVSLALQKKIVEDARSIEMLSISKELAKKSGLLSKMGKIGTISRKGLLSVAVAGSLMFGGTAFARDVGVDVGRKINIQATDSVLERGGKLTNIIDTTLALTDKGAKNLDNTFALLYRTGIHESGMLEHLTQKGGGPAKSYFQIEPDTAADVVQRWAAKKSNADALGVLEKTSGLERKRLLSMGKADLGKLLTENQLFAASVARYRYKMDPGSIPASLEEQAKYWQKAYQRGGEEVAQKRISSFINSNIEFAKKVNAAMLQQEKILSKGGTASSKMMRFVKKLLPR